MAESPAMKPAPRWTPAPAVLLCLLLSFALGAQAAELRVFCPNTLRAPILDLARTFARSSGHRIEFVFASVGAVHKRIASGERADLMIGTLQGTRALIGLGRAIEDTQTPLVRSGLALLLTAARAGMTADDGEAISAALTDATSIVIPDARRGAPGGAHAEEWLVQLGLAEAVRPKLRRAADARDIAKQVASGAAELGVATMSDVVSSASIVVLGPLPESQPFGIQYAAVMVRGANQPEAVRAFLANLRSAAAEAIFRKAGYLPLP
jgi:molybdate transport system substrate-binding protein